MVGGVEKAVSLGDYSWRGYICLPGIKSAFPMCSCQPFTRLSCVLVSYKALSAFPTFCKRNIVMELKTLCCAGWILMFIFPTVFCCDRCLHKSKVSYYSSSQTVNEGACGYESFAAALNRGNVATASAKIYREGVGCGGCFQIRCTDPAICSKSGLKVMVSDFTQSNQTDFVLSARSFSSLAQPTKSSQLVKMGLVDVEYKRIPCDYPGKNMTVRIDKSSNYPYFLAVQFLYQGGQTDIMGVEVAQVGSSNWKFMTRKHGALWSMQQPPEGTMSVRLLVTSGYDGSWVWAKTAVLPSNWKVGSIYDSGVQIKEIAQEGCSPCDSQDWDLSQ